MEPEWDAERTKGLNRTFMELKLLEEMLKYLNLQS